MRLKKVLALVLATAISVGGISINAGTKNEVKADSGWSLTWSDEFDGNKLDTSAWTYEIGNGDWGWGNGEIQYYTRREDNVKVSGGNLQLIAKKENYNGFKYTSGRLITKKKKAFTYGYMEARIKVENGNQPGVWPAFWMMGNDIDSVGWPKCGELDIMEHANSNNFIGGCLHWGENNNSHQYSSSGQSGKDFVFTDNVNNGINGWHTYGVYWTDKYIEWYVDRKPFYKQYLTSNKAKYFKKDNFFLLNLAIGGPQTGFTSGVTANDSTFKTVTMYVDYVRAYQNPNESTTTKYDGPTITVTQDAVADFNGQWGSYFSTQAGWTQTSGTLTSGAKASDGFTANITSAGFTTGDSIWGVQGNLEGLTYYPGSTYKYKCTITSDQDKKVFVKVTNESEDLLAGEIISVKKGVPYNYETNVVIPDDYDGKISLKFGMGKADGDTIADNSAVTINVKDVSFKTTTQIKDPNYVAPTTTKPATTKPNTTKPTTKPEQTTKKPTQTTEKITAPGKVKVSKVYAKQLASKKIKLVIKKVKKSAGYQVAIYKSKSAARKDAKAKKALLKEFKTKTTVTLNSKKLKNKKKLYVKVRAYSLKGKTKVYGKWSDVKTVKVK